VRTFSLIVGIGRIGSGEKPHMGSLALASLLAHLAIALPVQAQVLETAMVSEAIAAGAGRAVLRGSRIRLPPERAPARAAADQCGTAARTDPRHTGTAPGSAAPLVRPTESASRCRTLCT
jgi:hypothetical protein